MAKQCRWILNTFPATHNCCKSFARPGIQCSSMSCVVILQCCLIPSSCFGSHRSQC
uniref:Uncharacterized protein n=2 Tax=Anguilla anguilla TaxID=7936 RepID=A0A0E9RD47_ANGAN